MRCKKSFTKLGSLVLTLVLLTSLLCVPAFAAGDTWLTQTVVSLDTTWYTGSLESTTYNISSEAQLASVAKLVNEGTAYFAGKTLYISKDLDMGAYKWVPIGTQARPFRGSIQSSGGPWTISNVNIDTAYANTGFVGYMDIGIDASMKPTAPSVAKLTIIGSITVETDSAANIGGVCGYAVPNSKLEKVTGNMTITVTGSGNVNVGGLLGAGTAAIQGCDNKGSINVTSDAADVGGIIGESDSSAFKANIQAGATRNNGNITVTAASANVGGIAGAVKAGEAMTFTDGETVDHSAQYIWSFGAINVTSAETANVGGFVGHAAGTLWLNGALFSRAIGVHGACGANVGGIVGLGSGSVRLENCKLTTAFTVLGISNTTMVDESSTTTAIVVDATGAVKTGGILGTAESGASVTGAVVGDAAETTEDYISKITSTGTVGGAVGDAPAGVTVRGEARWLTVTGVGASSKAGGGIGNNASGSIALSVHDMAVEATDADGSAIGGVIGKNSAALGKDNLKRSERLTLTAAGTNSTLGGVLGASSGAIAATYADSEGTLAFSDITIGSGLTDSSVGGFVGETTGDLSDLAGHGAAVDVYGTNTTVGGLVGKQNMGVIANSSLHALDMGISEDVANSIVGGVVGETASGAVVETSYIRGDITVSMTTGERKVGGIVGNNAGTVRECFCEAGVSVTGGTATVGGIAAASTGTVSDCFTASGINLSGSAGENTTVGVTETVGGIVGAATGGAIERCLNLAQVYVVRSAEGNAFFGAIAGKLDCTTLTYNYFDRQLSATPTAYYDNDGKPVRNPNNDCVKANYTPALLTADLPVGLAPAYWSASEGRYPVLKTFETNNSALLCVQPITFAQPDTIRAVSGSFTLGGNDTSWDGSGLDISNSTASLIDPSTATPVTLTRADVSRTIILNGGSVSYAEKCAAPTVHPGSKYFGGAASLTVTLSTATPEATIYYTLDGTLPDETKTKYTGAITLTPGDAADPAEQFTVKAIAVRDDWSDSNVLTAVYTEGRSPTPIGVVTRRTPVTLLLGQGGSARTGSVTETAQEGGRKVTVILTPNELRTVGAGSITTAVTVDAAGNRRHIPTMVSKDKNGNTVVTFTVPKNTDYALIENRKSFIDTEGKWYEDAVNEMADRLIIIGAGDFFEGDRSITRAEFAAILVRALGLPENGDPSAFTDVTEGAWYYGAVGKAYECGIVGGRGDGIFDPLAGITRQEAMAMVFRAASIIKFAGAGGSLSAFADADSISAWALNAACWNVGSGLIQGNSNGMICGQGDITRGETATVVLRLLQKSGLVDTRTYA